MDRLKKYDEIISMSGDKEKIDRNNELNYKLYCKVHSVDKDMLNWIKLEKRELAYGDAIDEEMIDEVLHEKKWTVDETNTVKSTNGWTCDDMNYNFIANLFYHKYKDYISEEDILKIAHVDSKEAYLHWKILKMSK